MFRWLASPSVKANPLQLPFAEKSVDACLLAHSLPWCDDPHRLLREADRVLIDDGWLVISGFNPMSLMGLRKLVPVLRRTPPYNSRMFTLMRQLDWLSLLNYEVLYQSGFQVIPGAAGREDAQHPFSGAGLYAVDSGA